MIPLAWFPVDHAVIHRLGHRWHCFWKNTLSSIMTSSLTSSEPHRLHHHKSQDCFESNTTGQCSLAGISADIKLPMGKAARYYECTQQICYRPSASVPTEHPSPHTRFKSHSLTFGDSVRRVVFSQMALEPIVMLTEARNT